MNNRSLTNTYGNPTKFVGLRMWKRVFTSEVFWTVMGVSLGAAINWSARSCRLFAPLSNISHQKSIRQCLFCRYDRLLRCLQSLYLSSARRRLAEQKDLGMTTHAAICEPPLLRFRLSDVSAPASFSCWSDSGMSPNRLKALFWTVPTICRKSDTSHSDGLLKSFVLF